MATSSVAVTPGTGKNLATHSVSEDAITKEISRANLNSAAGVDLTDATGVKISTASMGTLGVALAASSVPVVLPSDYALYAPSANLVSGAITTPMTGTTSTQLLAAPSSGLRNYITTIIVSNAHATIPTDVIITDGGTTLLTIPAAIGYGGAVVTLPTPLRQPTTATAIMCANVTTGASTKVSAVGYKAA
jgi:hypothetical protein